MKKLSKVGSENNSDESKKEKSENKEFLESGKNIVKIIKEEDEEIGKVKFGVYINYSRYMGGNLYLIIVIFVMVLWQATNGGSDLWLAYWSKPENQEATKDNPKSKWTFFEYIVYFVYQV
jgi:hypothetical protein